MLVNCVGWSGISIPNRVERGSLAVKQRLLPQRQYNTEVWYLQEASSWVAVSYNVGSAFTVVGCYPDAA